MKWPLGMIVPVQDPTPFSPFQPELWRKALAEVAQAGYQAVELAITDPARLDPDQAAEALQEAGLRLSSLTTGQAAAIEGLSLSSPDESVRKRAIARIKAHMRFAKSFGAVVIVGLLRGADGDLSLLAGSLKECASFDPDVKLALEPLNRYESKLINTVEEALEVVEGVGADNLGVLFDTFHANIEEAAPAQSILKAGSRLYHVHLADSNRWIPGHGHLDFPPLLEALDRIGYQGALVVEALLKPSPAALLSFPRAAEAILFESSRPS